MVREVTLSSDIELIQFWNELLSSSFESKLDLDKKVLITGTTLCVFLISALTGPEVTELNTLITNHDSDYHEWMIDNRIKREANRDNGFKFWDDYANDISFKIGQGTYTSTVGKSIYNSAEPITHHLTRGSWLSAHTEAQGLVITADFTLALKDDLLAQLKDYVNNNYPVFLHIP